MPELGKYAFEVGLAYAVSLGLLALLVGVYWRRAVVVKKRLYEAEKRAGTDRGGQGG